MNFVLVFVFDASRETKVTAPVGDCDCFSLAYFDLGAVASASLVGAINKITYLVSYLAAFFFDEFCFDF